MVGGVIGKKRLLVKFQDGFEKGLISSQLTAVKQEMSPHTEEAEEVKIPKKPFKTVDVDKILYQKVDVLLQLKKCVDTT